MDKSSEENSSIAKMNGTLGLVKGSMRMLKKQQQYTPSTSELKGKWQQQIDTAKMTWRKLTEDEILKSEGHLQKLISLIQERYAISHNEAEEKVIVFMDKYKN